MGVFFTKAENHRALDDLKDQLMSLNTICRTLENPVLKATRMEMV
jgi:hypothetical protein